MYSTHWIVFWWLQKHNCVPRYCKKIQSDRIILCNAFNLQGNSKLCLVRSSNFHFYGLSESPSLPRSPHHCPCWGQVLGNCYIHCDQSCGLLRNPVNTHLAQPSTPGLTNPSLFILTWQTGNQLIQEGTNEGSSRQAYSFILAQFIPPL